MQILPESFVSASPFAASKPGAQKTIAQSGPFAELLNRLASKAAASDADNAAAGQSGAFANRNRGFGQAEAVELKLEDLARIKARLRQQGMSEADIADIQAGLEASGTLTWKGFIDAVSQKMGFAADDLPASFDAESRKELLGLLGKLGYTPQESSDIAAELAQGKNSKVWEKITARTSALERNDLATITRNELLALAAAMNVSQAGMKRLDEMLGGGQELGLTANGVNAALSTILTEAVKARQGLESNLSQLKADLSRGLQEAVNQAEIARLADNKASKAAQAAKVLIEDAAEKNRDKEAVRTRIGIAQEVRQQAGATKKGLPLTTAETEAAPARNEHPNKAEQHGATRHEAKVNAFKAEPENASAGKDGAGLAGAETRSGKETPKTGARHEAFVRDELAGFDEEFNPEIESPVQAPVSPETPLEHSANLLPQQLMQTIESGILSNLGEGRRQFTLSLEPETLGALNIVLQIHNKDVTALIRTENQDVTRTLDENKHQLRQQLEQQGLNVEKLDVQTQLSGEHIFRDWQGAQQYTQAQSQEQEMRQRVLSSMRLLRGVGEAQADLVQGMRYAGRRETNFFSAVDLLA